MRVLSLPLQPSQQPDQSGWAAVATPGQQGHSWPAPLFWQGKVCNQSHVAISRISLRARIKLNARHFTRFAPSVAAGAAAGPLLPSAPGLITQISNLRYMSDRSQTALHSLLTSLLTTISIFPTDFLCLPGFPSVQCRLGRCGRPIRLCLIGGRRG